jgi:hypothetical protein
VRSGALPLAGWGAALLAIDLLGVLVFDLAALPASLLAAAGVGSLLLAAVTAARPPHPGEAVQLESPGTTIACAGAAIAVLGASAGGPAFTWPGVGIALAGLAVVAGERRS